MLKAALVRAAAWAAATMLTISHLLALVNGFGATPMPRAVTETLVLTGDHNWAFAGHFAANCAYYFLTQCEAHYWKASFQAIVLIALMWDSIRLARQAGHLPAQWRALRGEVRDDLIAFWSRSTHLVHEIVDRVRGIPDALRDRREARAARRRQALAAQARHKVGKRKRARSRPNARPLTPVAVQSDSRDAGTPYKAQSIAIEANESMASFPVPALEQDVLPPLEPPPAAQPPAA